jgi:hypothetical protein
VIAVDTSVVVAAPRAGTKAAAVRAGRGLACGTRAHRNTPAEELLPPHRAPADLVAAFLVERFRILRAAPRLCRVRRGNPQAWDWRAVQIDALIAATVRHAGAAIIKAAARNSLRHAQSS